MAADNFATAGATAFLWAAAAAGTRCLEDCAAGTAAAVVVADSLATRGAATADFGAGDFAVWALAAGFVFITGFCALVPPLAVTASATTRDLLFTGIQLLLLP